MKQSDEYCLVQIVDGVEKPVTSFQCLPDNSVLRFKLKEPKTSPFTFCNKSDETIRKKLKTLEKNMDLLLTASGNELRLLSDMDTSKYQPFKPEFLERVASLAHQALLIKQEKNAVMGIKDATYMSNMVDRKHAFPYPRQSIGEVTSLRVFRVFLLTTFTFFQIH